MAMEIKLSFREVIIMPKTKNAFALENFDESSILSRPFFKDFGFGNLTDEEILQSLMVTDGDNVDDMEQKLSQIKALHERGKKFDNLITRHLERLEYFTEKWGDYYQTKYLLWKWDLVKVLSQLAKTYNEVEEQIQRKYKEDLTTRLKQYRKTAGLTQKELGGLVGVSSLGYSRYERGEREIPIHTIVRLAKVFHISGDEILGLK